MKLLLKILLSLLTITSISFAQNLVPNPSFEDTVHCPTNPSQINYTQYWISPTSASPDYFNACDPTIYGMNVPYNGFGYQKARTGDAYAGFYAYNTVHTDYKEYIQTSLLSTLINGHNYIVSFYVNLSNWSQYSVSSVGAYFSSIPISSTSSLVLNYTPQIQNKSSVQLSDSVNWMLIQDTLVANGTEKYVTIGNFKTDGQSDTVYIGWFSSANIAYYYIDDVSVIDVQDLAVNELSNIGLEVFPNPANSILNIEAQLQDAEIKIFDVLGNEVRSEKPNYKRQIDISELTKGIYFLQLMKNGKAYSTKFAKE